MRDTSAARDLFVTSGRSCLRVRLPGERDCMRAAVAAHPACIAVRLVGPEVARWQKAGRPIHGNDVLCELWKKTRTIGVNRKQFRRLDSNQHKPASKAGGLPITQRRIAITLCCWTLLSNRCSTIPAKSLPGLSAFEASRLVRSPVALGRRVHSGGGSPRRASSRVELLIGPRISLISRRDLPARRSWNDMEVRFRSVVAGAVRAGAARVPACSGAPVPDRRLAWPCVIVS